MSSLYVLKIRPLSEVSLANMFSHTVSSLFILMLFSLALQKLFILMRSRVIINSTSSPLECPGVDDKSYGRFTDTSPEQA